MTSFDPLWHKKVIYMDVSIAPKWTLNGMSLDECPFYDLCFSFEWLFASTCSILNYLTQASKICGCVTRGFPVLWAIEKQALGSLSSNISPMHIVNKVLMSNYPLISKFDFGPRWILLLTRLWNSKWNETCTQCCTNVRLGVYEVKSQILPK